MKILGDRPVTIVGVVEQARLYDVHEDGRPQIFVRAEDWGYRPLLYVIRTGRDPHALIPEVRSAVRKLDPRVAIGDVRTMDEIVGDALRQQRTSAALTTAFALGALLLAALGLFGVVSRMAAFPATSPREFQPTTLGAGPINSWSGSC